MASAAMRGSAGSVMVTDGVYVFGEGVEMVGVAVAN